MSSREVLTLYQNKEISAAAGTQSSTEDGIREVYYHKGGVLCVRVQDFTDNSGSGTGYLQFELYASPNGGVSWHPVGGIVQSGGTWDASSYSPSFQVSEAGSCAVVYIPNFGGTMFKLKVVAESASATFDAWLVLDP